MILDIQDHRNRSTWSKPHAQRDLDLWSTSHIFRGEERARSHVRELLHQRPILDLGVGTGRTVPLLQPMTTDYRGLDYLPEMVEICKRRHPNARIELGDARYLAGYPDAYFGLVNFSFNGLDAVSHGDRILVLKSVRRVLAPGGMFHFSTLNIDGPGFGERPWRIQVGRTRNPLRYAFRALDAALAIPVSIWNWAQLRRSEQRGPGYAVAPISAHRFGVLVHFTSLKRQMDELADAGFSGDVVVFENDTGERIPAEVGATTAHWFEVVARSPG